MHTLSNHDYFVAHRAFFFDLSPWVDEVPNDDPSQPLGLDRATSLSLLPEVPVELVDPSTFFGLVREAQEGRSP